MAPAGEGVAPAGEGVAPAGEELADLARLEAGVAAEAEEANPEADAEADDTVANLPSQLTPVEQRAVEAVDAAREQFNRIQTVAPADRAMQRERAARLARMAIAAENLAVAANPAYQRRIPVRDPRGGFSSHSTRRHSVVRSSKFRARKTWRR